MSVTERIRRRARPAGLALALPAVFVLGTMDAAAQERDWDTQEQEQEQVQEQPMAGQDLIATAEGIQEISLFVQALKQTGLHEAIQMEGPYTIFAPTNEALRDHYDDDDLERFGLKVKDERAKDERAEREYDPAMEREERDEWQEEDRPAYDDQQARDKQERHVQQAQLSPEDREELTRFVRAHIVMGELSGDRLATTEEVHNVLGQTLAIEVDEEQRRAALETPVRDDAEWDERQDDERWDAEHARMEHEETGIEIENIEVVRADVRAGNGILHVIEGVIEPADEEELREEREEREQEWQDREDDDWQDRDDDWQDDRP